MAEEYLLWLRGTYSGQGVSILAGGTYPGYPGSGVPTLARVYLPWPPRLGGTYPGLGGYLPWPGGNYPDQGGQTNVCENSTFPHPSDAGCNNTEPLLSYIPPSIY